MKPIVVFNCFKLCLLVFICTADAVDNANGVDNDAIDDVAVDDAVDDVAVDDAVDDVAVDDAVDDVAVDDAVDGGAIDDTVDGGAVDDAVDDVAVDDAVDDVTLNDSNTGGAVGDADSGGAVNDANADGGVNGKGGIPNHVPKDRDKAGADQPVDGVEMDNDANAAINGDENENEGQIGAPVEDQESINTVVPDDNVKLDEAVDDNKINDLPNNDQTYVDPVFKLSSAEIKKFKIWPEAKIPYFIDEFSYDKVLRDKIREHLDNAQRRLKFVNFHELPEPLTDDNERWVFFVNRRGQLDCKDYSTKSFTNKGVQKVVVGYDCFKHNGPMAAIVLALLGVSPMHNAPNRDKYITINKEHILPDKMGLFKSLNNDEWLFHDIPYDYDSVSHYPLHKYTADGSETITISNDKENDTRNQGKMLGGEKKDESERRRKNHIVIQHPQINALTSNDGEAKDYSPWDKKKVALLYENIWYLKAKLGLNLEECKGLYRAGPGLTRLNQQKELPEKPKPKLYLTAIQKLFATKDVYGETLSSLEVAVLPLDISSDNPEVVASEIEKELKNFNKYDVDDDRRDRMASSVEDTMDDDAAPQALIGKKNRLKKSKSRLVVDINAEIDESETIASISNEKSDDTEHIENHEPENNSLQDNNDGDKHIYHDENNSNSRSPSTAKDRRNQPIIFSSENEYDIKKLAAFPGLKLSPSKMIKFKIWPEAKIPFFIDEFSYDKVLRDQIRGYLDHAKPLTGLNFVELATPPQDENKRWVFFINRRGQLDCKDYSTKSFTNSGVQRVIIGYDCLQNNGPMAAIVLALAGVPPQHNAPNRDRYINVSMKSILPEKRDLFKRLDDKDWLFHDLHYDYYSIGHYPSHQYTADGSATITAYGEGMRETLSYPNFHSQYLKRKVLYMKHDEYDTYSTTDIQKIRLLYNNILQNLPRMKSELCKNFYKPRPAQLQSRMSKMKVSKEEKNLLN